MTREALNELCARWQEARNNGTPVSPEELCRERPDLLPALRRRLASVFGLEDCDSAATNAQASEPSSYGAARALWGRGTFPRGRPAPATAHDAEVGGTAEEGGGESSDSWRLGPTILLDRLQ